MKDVNLEILEKMDFKLPLTDRVAAYVLRRAFQVQSRIEGMREFAGLKAGRVADAVNAAADELQQRLDVVLARTQEGRKSMEYIRVGDGIVFADVAGQAQKLMVGDTVKLFYDGKPLFSRLSVGGDHVYIREFTVRGIAGDRINLEGEELNTSVYLNEGDYVCVTSIERGKYASEFYLNVNGIIFTTIAKWAASEEEEDEG